MTYLQVSLAGVPAIICHQDAHIKGFKDNNQVCFFEMFGGFWVDQDPELYNKMQEIEKEYNCKVYAITHEYTNFGEMYSFLIVTAYPEEWATLGL